MAVSSKQNGRLVTLHMHQCNAQLSTEKKITFEVQLEHHDVVLLHPAFCSPLIAASGAPLTFFILTDNDFQELYTSDKDPNKPKAKAIINKFLKIRPWDGSKSIKDQPLYTSVPTAIANIDCTYLGDMFGFKDGRIKDKDGKLLAVLRESTRKQYGALLKHLFQIDIQPTGLSAALPPGLYDAAWFVFDQEAAEAKSEHPFCEWQDRKTTAYLKGIAQGETRAYKINGTPFGFDFDESARIENYHPIYITAKPKLNLGHLTDVHVSSRQFVFRQSQAQVLQSKNPEQCTEADGDAPTHSPPIGTLVNVTFETLKDLLDTLGRSDIDALLLTGDLIDHNHNFDPMSQSEWAQHFKTPGHAWDALHQSHHEDDTRYPKHIDDRIVYSLFKYFYDTHKKPIFVVQGNHEMYTQPYGISPRIIMGMMRANEGIPADHNLTIYEALLMYGPDYNHVRTTGRFTAQNVDWFYTLFTPFTDYRFVHGEQSFVGLGWGDDEDIISNKLQGGGTLPRTPDSVSAAQYELVQAAVKEGSERILFTHFTFASYGTDIDLGKQGEINCNNSFKGYDHYDEGSFKQRRYEMYKFLADQEIDYALAGHSHRAGLYEPVSFSDGTRTYLKVQGHLMTGPGHRPNFEGARIITSGCGGPIGVQNYYEAGHAGLGGAGLDRPSGTKLTLNGGEHIALVLPSSAVPQAQPRFAVALDYFDLLKERVFSRFESETDDDPLFAIELSRKLPNIQFIAGMALFAYLGGKWVKFAVTVAQEAGTHTLILKMKADEWKDFRKDVLKEKNVVLFLSTAFTDKLAAITGYTAYNYDSTWLMRVEIKPRMRTEGYGEDAVEVLAGGYTVKRHERHGEIPDFKWYKKNFKKLYPYTHKLPRSETTDE